jgi:DivIVA protein
MPDQSSAANEHAILQEITAPLSTLPDDPVPLVADVNFPLALRGYDRLAVDAYVKKTSQLVAELQATRSPEAAIRRALERVGEQISGILQRAHETAEQITAQSRREAEDRLEVARDEAAAIVSNAEQRVKDLDADTDRIWAERHRIVADTRGLAQELLALAQTAGEKFPAAEDTGALDEEAGAVSDADEVGLGSVGEEPGSVSIIEEPGVSSIGEEPGGGPAGPERGGGPAGPERGGGPGGSEPGGGSIEEEGGVEGETRASEPGGLAPEQDPGDDVTAVMPPLDVSELERPPTEEHDRQPREHGRPDQ